MSQFSVIVPVYKVEPYLRRCVDSILAQTFTDFEIILVDDGSPDGCPAICDEYAEKDNRVKVIHKENGGLSSARNVGVSVANGTYITFVDSDDYVLNTFLSDMMRSDSDLLCQAACRVDELGNKIGRYIFSDERIDKVTREILIRLYQESVLHCCGFKRYRRSIICDNSMKWRENQKNNEDVLFNVQYAQFCQTIDVQNIANYYYVIYQSRKTLSNTESLESFSHMRKGVGMVVRTLSDGDEKLAREIYCQKQIATYSGFYHDIYNGSLSFAEGWKYVCYLSEDDLFLQMIQTHPNSCVSEKTATAFLSGNKNKLWLNHVDYWARTKAHRFLKR